MNYIKDLFLQSIENPTIPVDSNQHIFRNRQSEHGFVSTPLQPKLEKKDCTIGQVWEKTVKANENKPVFGSRALVKVSLSPPQKKRNVSHLFP